MGGRRCPGAPGTCERDRKRRGRGGRALAERLGKLLAGATTPETVERTWALGPTPGEGVSRVLALARRARDERCKLAMLYCGSSAESSRRVVHPHQVVQAGGAWYIVAWCEQANGPRRFRVERVLEAELLAEQFERCPPNQLPMYAERALASLGAEGMAPFAAILARRVAELPTPAKRERVDKVLGRLQRDPVTCPRSTTPRSR